MDEEKEIRDYLFKEWESTMNLKDEVGKAYLGYRIDNIKERRELYKHLNLLSVAILAISPFIIEKSSASLYAFLATFIYIAVVIITISYYREALDKEGKDLEEQSDSYSKIFDERQSIIMKYLQRSQLSLLSVKEYLGELNKSSGKGWLELDLECFEREKEKRRENPSYFTELVVFLFSIASFLLFISFTNSPSPYIVAVISVLIFSYTFSPSITWSIDKNFSKLVHSLCNVRNRNKNFEK